MITKRHKSERVENKKTKTDSLNNTKKKKTDNLFIHYHITHTATENFKISQSETKDTESFKFSETDIIVTFIRSKNNHSPNQHDVVKNSLQTPSPGKKRAQQRATQTLKNSIFIRKSDLKVLPSSSSG